MDFIKQLLITFYHLIISKMLIYTQITTLPEVGHYFVVHFHRDNIACTRSQILPSFFDVTGQPYFDKIVSLSLTLSSCHIMNDIVASSAEEVMTTYCQ